MLCCSFCGKQQNEIYKLIAGPTVFICDECIEVCADIIEEERQREGKGCTNQLVDELNPLLDSSPELIQMSLLDFLREYNGSPALTTLTIGDVLVLYQKAVYLQRSFESTDQPVSQGDQQSGSQPVPSPEEDGSAILWKLRGESKLTYNFHGLSALQAWVSNLAKGREALISIDGKEWKRYGDFVDAVAAAKAAGATASLVTIFREMPTFATTQCPDDVVDKPLTDPRD